MLSTNTPGKDKQRPDYQGLELGSVTDWTVKSWELVNNGRRTLTRSPKTFYSAWKVKDPRWPQQNFLPSFIDHTASAGSRWKQVKLLCLKLSPTVPLWVPKLWLLKALSRLYILKRLLMLRMFYESAVSSVILSAVVCWGSRITPTDRPTWTECRTVSV